MGKYPNLTGLIGISTNFPRNFNAMQFQPYSNQVKLTNIRAVCQNFPTNSNQNWWASECSRESIDKEKSLNNLNFTLNRIKVPLQASKTVNTAKFICVLFKFQTHKIQSLFVIVDRLKLVLLCDLCNLVRCQWAKFDFLIWRILSAVCEYFLYEKVKFQYRLGKYLLYSFCSLKSNMNTKISSLDCYSEMLKDVCNHLTNTYSFSFEQNPAQDGITSIARHEIGGHFTKTNRFKNQSITVKSF